MTTDEAFEAWLATVPDLYATSRSDYRRLKTAWDAATEWAAKLAKSEELRLAHGGRATAREIADAIHSTPETIQ